MSQLDTLYKKRRKRVRRRNRARKAADQDRAILARERKELAKHQRQRAQHVKAIAKIDVMIEKNKARKPRINGNKVTGGSARDRLKAAALEAAAMDANGTYRFYSQAGAWTVQYGITGEPKGYRSDCSQWVTSIYWSCGLPDPNGLNYTGGYTGTLASNGREISRDELRPGDLILYGASPFFHTEMYVGPGDKTIGHGSAPVDAGTIDMVSGPKQYRTYL